MESLSADTYVQTSTLHKLYMVLALQQEKLWLEYEKHSSLGEHTKAIEMLHKRTGLSIAIDEVLAETTNTDTVVLSTTEILSVSLDVVDENVKNGNFDEAKQLTKEN